MILFNQTKHKKGKRNSMKPVFKCFKKEWIITTAFKNTGEYQAIHINK